MCKSIFLKALLLIISFSTFSQVEQDSISTDEKVRKHTFGVMIGYSWIIQNNESSENSLTIPTIGLDYGFWFNRQMAILMVNDLEMSQYVIESYDGELITRENKYVGALTFAYEPFENIGFYAGPGIELDSEEQFLLFKVGTEIGKKFEDGWAVGLNASIDINKAYATISSGIMVSKRL